jgi:asparagine synthase (glutamine-hydrolysing)
MKTLLPALLQIEDRVSMAHGLESRVPLIDKRIFEFIAKIPPKIKFKNGKLKYLFLEAVKNLLPQKIIDRKDKKGFPVPLNIWIKNDKKVRDFVLDLMTDDFAKNNAIYDVKKIEKLIYEENVFDRNLWGFLSLTVWQRNFGISF